jgi:hypothetical protein
MWSSGSIATLAALKSGADHSTALNADPSYARTELKREGDLWRNVDEFMALFSKAKHGNPYRVEFRLVERSI